MYERYLTIIIMFVDQSSAREERDNSSCQESDDSSSVYEDPEDTRSDYVNVPNLPSSNDELSQFPHTDFAGSEQVSSTLFLLP